MYEEEREQVTLESGGKKIFAILHLPKTENQQKFPAVLFCHGFGGNKSGKFRLFVRLAEKLAKSGIAVLRVDFRGSGDSEGDFKDTTIQSQLEDAASALAFFKNHPQIDAERIAVLGRSLGGMIAYATAVRHPEVKSLALLAPVFDGKPWIEKNKNNEKTVQSIQFDKTLNQFVFHGIPLSQAFIKEFFTFDGKTELQKLRDKPLLLVFGEKDAIIEKYHQEQYSEVRKAADAATKKVLLEHSDHDFHVPDEQTMLIEETVEWFQGHL